MLPSLFVLSSSRLFTSDSFVKLIPFCVPLIQKWGGGRAQGPSSRLWRLPHWAVGLRGESQTWNRGIESSCPPAVHLHLLPEPHPTSATRPRPASPRTENHRARKHGSQVGSLRLRVQGRGAPCPMSPCRLEAVPGAGASCSQPPALLPAPGQ